ncbi:hypothetical protein Cme02nite_02430 [Catellatospora methionotrophica]|uniref:Uncharacterized protein n=1 Tax=Catellatospora methionotrophica TaxID=121620 RepID=A0A8J3PBZ9_9ACTN|nr:hypothetical protein [Catellatospora methionotrophica]GIG11911.1 hypothetical protein Cme02nite_02430 [Catellatospora methionotrophica]
MTTPDALEREHTLQTAVTRYNDLRMREALAEPGLTAEEALQLLALGELIIRKAGYGRQLSVRNARRAGASWAQIGAALGIARQSAWEAHTRWINDQAEQFRSTGVSGFDAEQAAQARDLAGDAD